MTKQNISIPKIPDNSTYVKNDQVKQAILYTYDKCLEITSSILYQLSGGSDSLDGRQLTINDVLEELRQSIEVEKLKIKKQK